MKKLNCKNMRRIFIVIALAIVSIVSFNGCNNQTIRVYDISQDIIDYEQQRVPSFLQQSGTLLYGKEVTNITFDSLVVYGCNSIYDELSEKLTYNGYFVTTWDIQKTNWNASTTEQKTIYVSFSDLTIKKEGEQFSYEWHTDYLSALRSIM